jgi:Do/DeqQ family serine protease
MKERILFLAISILAGFFGTYAYNAVFQTPSNSNTISNPDERYAQFTQNGKPPIAAVGATANFDFVVASAVSTPCVVYIKNISSNQSSNFFDLMFGGGGGGRQISSGSGVIYSADGYVITNNHVVADAEKIEVIHEKRTYKATVIGKDPSTDLAVLKIEGKNLPFVKVSDSHEVKVGEWVLAVGNPFNLNSTVTAGVVSAKGRNLNIVNSVFPIESFIQTDAAINPGNSGGALVNLKGDLIGINTAIYSQTGSYSGYGFAVPSDIVSKVVRDLIKYGEVQKAIAGMDVSDIDNNIANKLDLPDYNGVVVTKVEKEGAALDAGLEANDVILKIDNVKVNSKATYDEELSYRDPGNKIKITYRRGTVQKEAIVLLTNLEGNTKLTKREVTNNEWMKASISPLSKSEKTKLNVSSGVRVVKMETESVMRRLNIKEGQIIVAIDYQPVNNDEELEAALKKARGRIILDIVENNGQRYQIQHWIQ